MTRIAYQVEIVKNARTSCIWGDFETLKEAQRVYDYYCEKESNNNVARVVLTKLIYDDDYDSEPIDEETIAVSDFRK